MCIPTAQPTKLDICFSIIACLYKPLVGAHPSHMNYIHVRKHNYFRKGYSFLSCDLDTLTLIRMWVDSFVLIALLHQILFPFQKVRRVYGHDREPWTSVHVHVIFIWRQVPCDTVVT